MFCFLLSSGFGFFLLCVLTPCHSPRPPPSYPGERQWEKIKAWDTSFPSSLSCCAPSGCRRVPFKPREQPPMMRGIKEAFSSGMDIIVEGLMKSFWFLKWACRCGKWVPCQSLVCCKPRSTAQLSNWESEGGCRDKDGDSSFYRERPPVRIADLQVW